MIKLWRQDASSEEVFTRSKIVNIKDLMSLRIMSGESLTGKMPAVTISVARDEHLVDFFRCGPLYFIVSVELRAVLDGCGVGNVEYFPLDLRYDGKKLAKQFYFCNIMNFCECVDLEASNLIYSNGEISGVKSLELDERKATGLSLFRVSNLQDLVLGVSQKLQNLVLESGCRGVTFMDPSQLEITPLF